MPDFRRPLLLVAALGATSAADTLPCGHCLAISESIHRSINLNISAFEREVHLGTQRTATIEIGQIIWHLCGSEAWKSQRYSEALDASCAQYVRPHVDMMTNFWKEHAADTYKDPVRRGGRGRGRGPVSRTLAAAPRALTLGRPVLPRRRPSRSA